MKLLHWSVEELLSIVVHRYLLYLYAWKASDHRLDEPYEELVKIPIYTRPRAIEFFERILPDSITNERKISEKTLIYILKHFQVLPRQLISLFNSMLSLTLKKGGMPDIIECSTVLSSIQQQEAIMAEEIIKAYSPMYPEASKLRKKVLPNIPLLFSYRD